MIRSCLLALAAAGLLSLRAAAADGEDGPPISIVSPDHGTTFAYGTVKTHALVWNKQTKTLVAHVTFTDQELNTGDPQTDYHEFRLPGVMFDPSTGFFYAKTAKGEVVPIAHYKKVLFINSIEVLPNAAVRIQHPRGDLTVTLEAIFPNSPGMHPPDDADGTHKVDIGSVLN